MNQGDISKLSAFSGSSEILLMPNIRMRVGAVSTGEVTERTKKFHASKSSPPKNVLKNICWGGFF